jgi:hypothetical protein
VHKIFVLLTHCAAFDIFGDPCPSARPKILVIDVSYSFVSARVAVEWSIVP